MTLDWIARVGLERERNPTAKASLRTFALVALTGAASAFLAEKFAAPSLSRPGWARSP